MVNIDAKLIEEICEQGLEYLILGGLISADANMTDEDREENINSLEGFKNAIKESSLDDNKKTQLIEYAEKGKEILQNELEKS